MGDEFAELRSAFGLAGRRRYVRERWSCVGLRGFDLVRYDNRLRLIANWVMGAGAGADDDQ
jgi:hypothetical protein